MVWNTNFYMNSCITSEYTDYEVLEVVKYIADVLQNTALDAIRAHIKPSGYRPRANGRVPQPPLTMRRPRLDPLSFPSS
jgi:hypothetical protein